MASYAFNEINENIQIKFKNYFVTTQAFLASFNATAVSHNALRQTLTPTNRGNYISGSGRLRKFRVKLNAQG